MGVVYEAEDLESGRRVALKVLSHKLDSPEARNRFFREGRLAASINHPNSVYVFGTEEIAGTPVIAMELVSGGTFKDRVREKGPLPIREAVDAVLQMIEGLAAAQRIGILHRDIKPSNCYVGEDGTVKIGDFGLSISTAIRIEPALTATGSFLGTPAFCSPEQLRGDELNARSDMYAVGATLYYLLTGRTPFEAKKSCNCWLQCWSNARFRRGSSGRTFPTAWPRSCCVAWKNSRANGSRATRNWPGRWRLTARPLRRRPHWACGSWPARWTGCSWAAWGVQAGVWGPYGSSWIRP